jgi:hypothetical protein
MRKRAAAGLEQQLAHGAPLSGPTPTSCGM